MAAVAYPTWAEVQTMSPMEVDAFNIIKGEANGDKFLWDQEWVDPETGVLVTGVWQSMLEKKK